MTSLPYRPFRVLGLGFTLALGAFLAPACSGNPAARLCREVCDCAGCSDSEEEDCIEAADEAQADAESAGCTAEFDTYLDCRKSAFKCDDERAVFTESCESEAEDLVECGGNVPGTGSVCDQAVTICGAGEGEGESPECSGDVECISQCIVDANSCDFQNDPGLNDCLNSCVGGF